MGKIKYDDLSGMRFGRLVVNEMIRIADRSGHTRRKCVCICDCGRQIITSPYDLLRGVTNSCGCLRRKVTEENITKEYIEYIKRDGYYELVFHNGFVGYIDEEDYDLVSQYQMVVRHDGYIYAYNKCNSKKLILLHRLIMQQYYDIDNVIIDHIHDPQSRGDNRKNNLRIVTNSQNSMNAGLRKNNTSGVTGVFWSNKDKRWIARITSEYKVYNLGQFKNFDDAVAARKAAEDKYFGEYSYDNSQALGKQVNMN